jgi:GNAT superfamily N-acetyltransferase
LRFRAFPHNRKRGAQIQIGRNGEPVEFTIRELGDPQDPALAGARGLYESTLDAEERIPWEWVAAAARRGRGQRRDWHSHLLVAEPAPAGNSVIGFAYGAHIRDYGGYACYLGVDPARRGRGVATGLLRGLVQVFREDAAEMGTSLPFVIWESREPAAGASPAERELWVARLRLFRRLGAFQISGLTFWAPNFARRGGTAVPLQLFLLPMAARPEQFLAGALRDVAAGLMRRVYGRDEGDPLFEQTFRSSGRPALRPVEALRDMTNP